MTFVRVDWIASVTNQPLAGRVAEEEREGTKRGSKESRAKF